MSVYAKYSGLSRRSSLISRVYGKAHISLVPPVQGITHSRRTVSGRAREKKIDEPRAQLARKWTAVVAKAVKSVWTFTSGEITHGQKIPDTRSPASETAATTAIVRFRKRLRDLSFPTPSDVNKNDNGFMLDLYTSRTHTFYFKLSFYVRQILFIYIV